MPKPEKLYYKIPTPTKDGKICFNNQILTIKTEHLGRVSKMAIKEYAEAEPHAILRRFATIHIADEDYNLAREELNFSSLIEKKSDNDYISIFNGNNDMILTIRPASKRQVDVIAFEDWEKEQKAKLEKEKAEIQAKADAANNL